MVCQMAWFLASCAAWRHDVAEKAAKNGWEGIHCLRSGCVRDVEACGSNPLWASRRCASHPMKTDKRWYRRFNVASGFRRGYLSAGRVRGMRQ